MMKLDSEEVQRITREMNRYLDGITIEELMMIRQKRFFYEVRLSETQCKQEIMTLDLSQRAYNCLRRAGVNTVGQILDRFHDTGDQSSKHQLQQLKNLGRGTADEILMKLFFYQFSVLPEEKRASYMKRVLEMNIQAVA